MNALQYRNAMNTLHRVANDNVGKEVVLISNGKHYDVICKDNEVLFNAYVNQGYSIVAEEKLEVV